ncbi:hypothetical protein [Haloarchaeobius baliensis]|uniref:hypothetical protein n=1 Tax=Haloarchaeobius baliensis TaxID=1670458 RepID=UPI003F8824D2
MHPDDRVDVLRYPPESDYDPVQAVPAGEGAEIVRSRRDDRRERRERRIVFWVALPLVSVFMTLGPSSLIGLPWWTPLAAGAASLSLCWWLFTVVDARRDTGVPELVATNCAVSTARKRWNATVLDARPVPEGDALGDVERSADDVAPTTWTARVRRDDEVETER